MDFVMEVVIYRDGWLVQIVIGDISTAFLYRYVPIMLLKLRPLCPIYVPESKARWLLYLLYLQLEHNIDFINWL